MNSVLYRCLGRCQTFELADIGADDEAGGFAAHDDEAGKLASTLRLLHPFDDLAEFLGRTASERIHAVAFAIDQRPGDTLEIDRETPVLEIRQWSRGRHYSAAMVSEEGRGEDLVSGFWLRASSAASKSSTAITRATRIRSSAR